MHTISEWWMWPLFAGFVVAMLLIDLFLVGGGKQHRVSAKEALIWSLIWVSMSFLFAGGFWWYLDMHYDRAIANEKTLEYLTGYLIEKSLAVDNVFVWIMLFSYFAVPLELQKRVLLLGVFGALILRTAMILAGSWLITQFHWILYVFGAFLLFTGIKMLWLADQSPDLEQNRLIRWLRSHMRITTELKGDHFFVMEKGVRYATPLFLALVLVEISDVIFAVDSIPAIFAITTDPFIVLTSNIFAILGLRAMYFLLADMADRFSLLKYGLAIVLVFIGVKMMLIDLYKIPVGFSLAVVATIIGISIGLSLLKNRRHERLKQERLQKAVTTDTSQ
ncbi:MAG TPA: TerC family protein [Dongiaceae bacterium]|nr:TerC family protein [Dongiaceae bacterium]